MVLPLLDSWAHNTAAVAASGCVLLARKENDEAGPSKRAASIHLLMSDVVPKRPRKGSFGLPTPPTLLSLRSPILMCVGVRHPQRCCPFLVLGKKKKGGSNQRWVDDASERASTSAPLWPLLLRGQRIGSKHRRLQLLAH